jgi:hypothetical protein
MAKERLTTESATASSGFCSGRGYNVCISHTLSAKNVSSLPNTEIDCVNHVIRKVRHPLGGG